MDIIIVFKQYLGSGSIAKTTTVCFSISPEELTEQRDSKTKYLRTTFIPNEAKRYSPNPKIQAVGYNPVCGGKEEKQRTHRRSVDPKRTQGNSVETSEG